MLKSYQAAVLCGVVLVAGIYSAHGDRWRESWRESRQACGEYRGWVLSENRRPKTPTKYVERRFWDEVVSEHNCKKLEVVKYSDTQPKTGTSWPEYLRSLQDES